MKSYKILVFSLLIFFGISCSNSSINSESDKAIPNEIYTSNAIKARDYCERNNLNTDFYILIDLKRHSGLKRFYIWNFKQNKITKSYMVSHGCGNHLWKQDFTKNNAQFSNEENSHCSSVGKYIIGERGYSDWGIHVKYLLHGQDNTNSNAIKRAIVLHSWEAVKDDEIYPEGTSEGWGCPAISNNAMLTMDEMIKNSDKKVLMWII